ncbi:MAG: Asp-tRNA(Asn)/Glu-tRNA(Gln) amidotransferase subunit GatB, partial [Actinomycetota bacterium]
MEFEIKIGLETHVELITDSKMFCGCSTKFGAAPNTQTCSICLGHPGTLPVINKKAFDYTLKVALALNCKIANFTQFHRKNYFYPDLPKGYQISQYDLPVGLNGYLDIKLNSKVKRIGISRVHMEEDTAKLLHFGETGRISEATGSGLDFNRCGIPLLEIVSAPDIKNVTQAKAYVMLLKKILEYLEVSDCNMEEGRFRVDANISVRKLRDEYSKARTELKNLNSFRFLEKGLSYEIKRQREILNKGEKLYLETRHFDSKTMTTKSMRIKEEAQDYRYFPEPDLVPIEISREWVDEIKKTVPELPSVRADRIKKQYDISDNDVEIITSTKSMADFFESCVKIYSYPKKISNWIIRDLLYLLNQKQIQIENCKISPNHLIEMLKMIEVGKISGKIAKSIFEEMFKTGK